MLPEFLRRVFVVFRPLLLVVFLGITPAQAELLVSPTRLLITESGPAAQVILRNTGQVARTYEVSWEQLVAQEDGTYDRSGTASEVPAAADIVRFSPRSVRLQPGETQIVRVQAQFRPGLEPGEYRSHLRFAGEPPPPLPDAPGGQAQAVIQISLAFSIPVVVRVGETGEVQVQVESVVPQVEASTSSVQPTRVLDITLARQGAASSFGDLLVEMQADQASPVVLVGRVTELSVFTETPRRTIRVPLRDDVVIPSGALLRVTYAGRGEYEGRVLAEQVLRLQ